LIFTDPYTSDLSGALQDLPGVIKEVLKSWRCPQKDEEKDVKVDGRDEV